MKSHQMLSRTRKTKDETRAQGRGSVVTAVLYTHRVISPVRFHFLVDLIDFPSIWFSSIYRLFWLKLPQQLLHMSSSSFTFFFF